MAALLLYDGECGLCGAAAGFVRAHGEPAAIRALPLQTPLGRHLRRVYGVEHIDSVVLVEDGRASVRSAAVLRACRRLRAPWRLAVALLIIPRALRDRAYDTLARHRATLSCALR